MHLKCIFLTLKLVSAAKFPKCEQLLINGMRKIYYFMLHHLSKVLP
jgi:hypothetical protein